MRVPEQAIERYLRYRDVGTALAVVFQRQIGTTARLLDHQAFINVRANKRKLLSSEM